MTDHLDRAAEVIGQHTPVDVPGYRLRYTVEAARAMEDAGLLVTPERDAAVAAKALRDAAKGVRDFADILTEQGDHHVSGCVGQADCAACVSRDLRALADRIEREAGETDE